VPETGYDLFEGDFLEDQAALPSGPFDLVALFGVLHHVPGAERRADLIRALSDRVAPGGVLAFTAWRFATQPRFQAHQVEAPADLALDPGDVLLDWRAEGVHAVRYCHALDDELTDLVRESGLLLLDAYRADGQSGDLNDYRLLRRQPPG
jgi:SAM-dependent methyltransferase